MKNWAWILPCWVWKYFFSHFPRQRVLLDGRTRFLVRLDEEFALVYDSLNKADELAKTPSVLTRRKQTNQLSRRSSVRTLPPARNLVLWQTPITISGAADVSTQGVYFGSWAPQDGSAANHPVNGVTFQGFSDPPGFTAGPTFDNGYDGFGSPNTSDDNYNTLLQFGRFSNEGTTPTFFSWSGMVPGNTYLVQIWVNDGRNIGESRSETVTGGSTTSEPVSFGSERNWAGPIHHRDICR